VIGFRLLSPEDDLEAITKLLHRAYARLGEMGLNYTAVDQSAEVTRLRCERGEAWLAVADDLVVGIGVLSQSPESTSYYGKPSVWAVHQFAIEPELQGHGLGAQLLSHLEQRARELGGTEVALDTAGAAHHLIDWYLRRRYRPVDSVSWPGKTYSSLIFAKPL
jgi:GNAT superfamily N-acetyltransferase